LVAGNRQKAGRQTWDMTEQRVLRLGHQIDKGHEPEPDHIALSADALEHAADDKSFSRPRWGAKQARRRGIGQQGGADVVDQGLLKFLGLDGRSGGDKRKWCLEQWL